MRNIFIFISLTSVLFTALIYLFWPPVLWALMVIIPFIVTGIYDMNQ